MNVRQIETNVEALMGSWSKDTFIYELLLAYGLPKATVTRAMKGTANMSKEPDVVQLKSKVLFKPVQGPRPPCLCGACSAASDVQRTICHRLISRPFSQRT